MSYSISHSTKKAFTLTRLLVVIAIIALLAIALVFARDRAKNREVDASIKSELANMRASAEIYRLNVGSYGSPVFVDYIGKCNIEKSESIFGSFAVGNLKGSTDYINTMVGAGTTNCASDIDSWAFGAQLSDDSSWCVDSSGASKLGEVASTGALCL